MLRIYGEGQRNAYDLVWHSNGNLYATTNGSAGGGVSPDDPSTQIDESAVHPTQDDYLFRVVEGGYSGHPNPLRDKFILNGGNPTGGTDPNEAEQWWKRVSSRDFARPGLRFRKRLLAGQEPLAQRRHRIQEQRVRQPRCRAR